MAGETISNGDAYALELVDISIHHAARRPTDGGIAILDGERPRTAHPYDPSPALGLTASRRR